MRAWHRMQRGRSIGDSKTSVKDRRHGIAVLSEIWREYASLSRLEMQPAEQR
jgi:hypothetical protein